MIIDNHRLSSSHYLKFMRIAAINTTADMRRAPSRLMLQTLAAAHEEGCEVRAYYGRGVADTDIEAVRIGSDFATLLHYGKALLADGEGLGSRDATERLCADLAEWHPDVVHLHNLHGHYLHVPLLLNVLHQMSVPVVITLHDYWLMTGHCAFPGECTAWQQGCNVKVCPHRADYPKALVSRINRNISKRVSWLALLNDLHLVVPSRVMVEHLQESRLCATPCSVIHNGVDESLFRPDGTAPENMILGVANRWDTRKHLERLLQIPLHEGERLVIVGKKVPGVESYANLTQEQLARLYRRAKVFVNTSEAETFGMTTVEALMSGTPVVVDKGYVLREMTRTGRGKVCETADTADAQALREAIDRAAGHSREACRKFAEQHFTLRQMTDAYLSLYRRMTIDNHRLPIDR